MELLFGQFLSLFILSIILVIGIGLVLYKKLIIWRDLVIIGIFSGVLIVFISCFNFGSKIQFELTNKIHLTNEMNSNINYKDSTINDILLYSMIIDLRIPHKNIVFAQAKLESDTYKSDLYKSNFNLFGMKFAVKRPTTTKNEIRGYQAYDNWKESVIDLLIWQFVNNMDKVSDKDYLKYLQLKYAEDPEYMIKLNRILSKTDFKKLYENGNN